MPKASVDDVRGAFIAALQHFEANNANTQPPNQFFDAYSDDTGIPVIFNRVGTRWDYGHPSIWVMDQANVLHLQTYTDEQNLTILPRAWSGLKQCYEINLVKDVGGRTFNYHVAVT